MNHKHQSAVRLLLALFAAAVCPPAQAEDFNFEVPLEIDVATAGARRIQALVRCSVYWFSEPGRALVVGFEETFVDIDPATGHLHTSLFFNFNAEFPVPATATKYYSCGIQNVGYMYGAGTSGLSVMPDTAEADYLRVTGFPLTRHVVRVEGEIR